MISAESFPVGKELYVGRSFDSGAMLEVVFTNGPRDLLFKECAALYNANLAVEIRKRSLYQVDNSVLPSQLQPFQLIGV